MFCVILLLSASMLFASPAHAQDYALISPTIVRELPSQANTPAGRTMVRAADAAMDESPHPMKRLHTQGTLPHEGIRDQSIKAEKDFPLTRSFAFAYRLTGDKRYLVQAAKYLDAWFTAYKISGDPIDETRFDPMVVALDLTRADLPAETERHASEFFRQAAVTYLDWLEHNSSEDSNNWSSHRVKLAVLGSYACGDSALIDRAARAYLRQIKQNIHRDGSVNDFYKRDALHYVVYDLEPLTMAALAAKAHGKDWFHTAATGSPSVEMGIDWLVPFAIGAKTHQEFVHSSVKFDATRDQAGEAGYSGQWEPKTSVGLMAMAASLDQKYIPVLNKVEADTGSKAPSWVALARLIPEVSAAFIGNNYRR